MSTETLVQMRRAVRAVVFRFQGVKKSVEVEWKLSVVPSLAVTVPGQDPPMTCVPRIKSGATSGLQPCLPRPGNGEK